MKKWAIKASVFALISVSVMLHRAATKHIMITDAAGVPIERESTDNSYNLLVDRSVPSGKENTLIIPLAKSVKSDNIVLEDGYADHELRIYIDSNEAGFYKDNPVVTDLRILESAKCINRNENGSVCLDFGLNGLYVNESSLTESGTIEVKFYRPSDKYDRIVVVDCGSGGNTTDNTGDSMQAKDVALETALLLKNVADKDVDNDIKFYYTRLTDDFVDQEKRLKLIEDTGADLLIQLSAGDSGGDDPDEMIAYYNNTYFIRKLDNVELADIILRNCATVTGAEAQGVLPMEDSDFLLKESEVPSTRLFMGYVADGENVGTLLDETYRKRVAEGIYAGVLEAFEVMR